MDMGTETARAHIAAMRQYLASLDFAAIIVPRADSFLGGALSPHDERVAWLTGFTGSAGSVLLGPNAGRLLTDGRYLEQARLEMPADLLDVALASDEPALDLWLSAELPSRSRIAYMPWLHAIDDRVRWEARAKRTGIELCAMSSDPFDAIWLDRPAPSYHPAYLYDLALAGRPAADKRRDIAAAIRGIADAAVITSRESNAWLFNIRGSDLPDTPVADAMSIVCADGKAELFLRHGLPDAGLEAHMGAGVSLASLDELPDRLAYMALGKRLLLDPATTNSEIDTRLRAHGAIVVEAPDPCELPKAIKNKAEADAIRRGHIIDGAALTRFLCWLDGALAVRDVTETEAEEKLFQYRAASSEFTGPSFPTISAAGPNAAITHYTATSAMSRSLKAGSVYLVDSGGQYPGATTDVTRTVATQEPYPALRQQFTAVLQGHIALARAIFPPGTTGGELDPLARLPLWRMGLDYAHSTGHGVGAYLAVHEGPQKIRKGNQIPLEAGMILSNEPGYYETGSHGMRMENLMIVAASRSTNDGRSMLAFETLTMAPIDRRLIDIENLTKDEREWIDGYHRDVFAKIRALLDDPTLAWLANAARPL